MNIYALLVIPLSIKISFKMRVVGTTSAVGYDVGARSRERDMKRLEGKIAIVTGGGRGIDECTARRLARVGATLAIAESEEASGPIPRAAAEKELGGPVVFCRWSIV